MILILMLFINNSFATENKSIDTLLTEVEQTHNFVPGILHAIAEVETSKRPNIVTKHDGVSKFTSYGLLQIQYAAAKQMGFKGKPEDLLRPEMNISYGALYFKWLLKISNQDYAKALTCWNAGPNSKLCKSTKYRYSTYVGDILNSLLKRNKTLAFKP